MKLLCICPHWQEFYEPVRQHLSAQGHEVIAWEDGLRLPADNVWQEVDIVLLRSPIRIGRMAVQVEKAWQAWLLGVKPQARIITFGFIDTTADNYVDLLHLPSDWSTCFQRAMPTNQLTSWVDTFGLDVIYKLRRFLRGHDDRDADSVTSVFSKIIRQVQSLSDLYRVHRAAYPKLVEQIISGALLQDLGMSAQEISAYHPLELWQNFYARWLLYYPYFRFVPFAGQMQEINHNIELTAPFFRSGWQEEKMLQPCFEQLQCIHKILQDIEHIYVSKKELPHLNR